LKNCNRSQWQKKLLQEDTYYVSPAFINEIESMRKIVFQIILSVLYLSAQAQKVSNISAELRGQEIVVLYSLEATFPCEVSLLLSQDNGVTWGSPLKNVSGDVGKNISAGEKQIIWKVLEEKEYLVGDKMKFKVIANGRKSFEPEMVFVDGGTFQMGSDFGDSWEKPIHSVTLSSFNISKFEVTQAQWKAVMGDNPSSFENCDQCPVESVSWVEVQIFIRKLNALTGNTYRLPTEAEWEFAAKGGRNSTGYVYSGSSDLNSVAWNSGNSENQPHPVGGKKANELGIFDMTGNVWEWCIDWYDKYNDCHETNPTGAAKGWLRVLRGGGFGHDDHWCSPTIRFRCEPENENGFYGFRLVLPEVALVEPEMVFVEGGSFQMGSERISAAEKPIHTVTLSSFNIGKYEVTQAQWKAVMGSNPSKFSDCKDCPVENISRDDAQNFIRELNNLTGKNYRLPTEAEWEYAAKGGRRSKGYTYSGSNDINSVAWYKDNSGAKTHILGGKQPNELGIYDMSGNVWEWCFDWYDGYNSYSEINPTGSDDTSNLFRVLRGGSWDYPNISCGTAFRNGFGPHGKGDMFGLRLVLPVE
jgi:formylglycine-generating enzyme required for sulfatase activity